MKTNVKSNSGKTLRFAAAVVATAGLTLAAGAASADTVKLMSGSTGGTWDGLSGALKTIIERGVPGTTVNIRPGGAAVNVKAVGSGQADMGWMLATTTVEGIKGEPPFDTPLNICNVASFHPTVIQYVTNNPEIKTLADLGGKRVVTLPKGTGTEALARVMLGFQGLSEDDLGQYNFGSFPDAATMLKDHHADAFLGAAGMPAGGIMDMFSTVSDLRMLPVTDEDFAKLKNSNSAYVRYTIKADTYPNQPEDVVVAAFPTHLAANCDADEEQIYQITKAIIQDYKDLGSVINAISAYTLSDLTADIGVPFHAGAERAYKETGAL